MGREQNHPQIDIHIVTEVNTIGLQELFNLYSLAYFDLFSLVPLSRDTWKREVFLEPVGSQTQKTGNRDTKQLETSTDPVTRQTFSVVSPRYLENISEFIREIEQLETTTAPSWLEIIAAIPNFSLATDRRGFLVGCMKGLGAVLAQKATKKEISPQKYAAEVRRQNQELLAMIAYLQLYDARKQLLTHEQREKPSLVLSSEGYNGLRLVVDKTYKEVTQKLVKNQVFLAKLVYFYQKYNTIKEIFNYDVETIDVVTGDSKTRSVEFSNTDFLSQLEAAILAYLPTHPNNQNA